MKCNDIIASYPLTDIQKGILYEIVNSNYSTSIYIVQNIFSIQANFNLQFFTEAFNAMLIRHEILRSAIVQNSTGYVQVVYKEAKIPYEFYDCTAMLAEKQLNSFVTFLESDANKGLDLSIPPLMRLTVFKFSDSHYRFIWTRHHILMDGASVKILIDELFTIYHALLKGSQWILPAPISYAKALALAKQANIKAIKNYWTNALKAYANATLLPTLPGTYKNLKKIEHKHALIEGSNYSQLINFVNKHSLTINTVLQGALGIVLSHYSGNNQIILGAVRAYSREKINNCIGLFITTLPIYLEITPSQTTIDYLQNIRQKNNLIKQYINTPLSKIKEWNNLAVDTPLFQCVIDYKPYSLNTILKKHFPTATCTASIKLDIPYPLVVEVINEENALQINLHYDNTLFEDYYANALLKHFKEILRLISQEIVYLSEFPTLEEDELTKIINWNKTETAYPTHKTIHQLFEIQVQKTPSAIALCYQNQVLTYHMLNFQANQLAHYLIEQGVKIETPVAIYLKPTLNMLIAILGVLKAGGIYIPIDTQYPLERICYLLQDSQPKIIITESEHIASLKPIKRSQNGANSIFINLDAPEWKRCSDTNPLLPMQASCGMYIIYTSGSTGDPKGVLIEHHAVVNTALSCIERLQVTSQSRILQISSFSFDVSVAEWCMALLSGASLYLINKTIFSPEAIINSLKTYKITTIMLASSILAVLPREYLPDLKVIAPGGETCGLSAINFWAQGRLFINVYGITEAAICSTMSNFSPEQTKVADIGTPLPNTKIYILDQQLRQVPVGATGEIYIGGEGIARGYINNYEFNQKKFILYTFSSQNKNVTIRLYKTGDYGRWLPTGNIDYLGRKDEQIKIRGFRVELAEIEQNLEKHSAIKRAAVAVKDTATGKQLIAYILPAKKIVNINVIRKFIQTRLPSFMVPAQFYSLKELPLTPNGKIDKQKLLLLASAEMLNKQKYNTSASFEVEDTIKQAVQALLHRVQVPIDINFLDLGFDSLSLVQFAEYLSQILAKKITILDLFTYTTIKAVSAYISNETHNDIAVKNRHRQGRTVKANRVVFADEY